MTKPPKTDFKALITGQVAPAVSPEFDTPPAIEAAAFEPAVPPPPALEVVSLKPKRAPSIQKPAGQGTLKERARQLSLYLEEPVYDALRDIAHSERTKLHPLILEGIDLLLKKRGSLSIKELTKKTG